jgi:hypothetical protein
VNHDRSIPRYRDEGRHHEYRLVRQDRCAFDPVEVPNALAQIARLAEAVKWEFDLIAGRMTWLVVSE